MVCERRGCARDKAGAGQLARARRLHVAVVERRIWPEQRISGRGERSRRPAHVVSAKSVTYNSTPRLSVTSLCSSINPVSGGSQAMTTGLVVFPFTLGECLDPPDCSFALTAIQQPPTKALPKSVTNRLGRVPSYIQQHEGSPDDQHRNGELGGDLNEALSIEEQFGQVARLDGVSVDADPPGRSNPIKELVRWGGEFEPFSRSNHPAGDRSVRHRACAKGVILDVGVLPAEGNCERVWVRRPICNSYARYGYRANNKLGLSSRSDFIPERRTGLKVG